MAGNYVGKCKGVGGYDLEYYLDDERNSIGVVFPSIKVADLNFWSYFRGFSELGSKAEWRMKNNKPVALIVRLNVSDQGDGTKKTSYLIVAKISEENACVTDVLKPSKDQNVKARQLADKASTKKCMPEFAQSDSPEDMEMPKPESAMVDGFTLGNNEDLIARLDNYVVTLQNNPSASGYIITNGDKNSRVKAEKQIKDYIKTRGLNLNRLVFLKGNGDSKVMIQLWLVPEGAKPPVI